MRRVWAVLFFVWLFVLKPFLLIFSFVLISLMQTGHVIPHVIAIQLCRTTEGSSPWKDSILSGLAGLYIGYKGII